MPKKAKEKSLYFVAGEAAFAAGKMRAPALDPDLVLPKGPIGSHIEPLKQWLAGWDTACAANMMESLK